MLRSLKTCSVVNMAASFAVTLSQDNIPGASLEGRQTPSRAQQPEVLGKMQGR